MRKPDHLSFCFENNVARLAISNTILSDMLFDPVVLLLGVFPTEILPHMHLDICIRIFIAVFFIIENRK